MKILLRTLTITALALFLGICVNFNYTYNDKMVSAPATLTRHENYKYLISLPYHERGRNLPHPIGCPKGYERDGLHSIGVNMDKGYISGENIFLNEAAEYTPDIFSGHLRGYISMTATSIEIRLQTPYYSDGERISHYVPYVFNGEYTLRRELK